MGKTYSMDLERYIEEMKRKGLHRESKNDHIVLCPHCYEEHMNRGIRGYRKLKLYIDKDGAYGHCFVCGSVFLSNDQSLKTNINPIEPKVDMSNWELCKLGNEGYWNLDRFYSFSEDDEIGVDYLSKKRYYEYRNIYKKLGIRFKDHNPVIPFYYKGELIFYQMRIISPDSDIKYFTPPTPHKNPYIIETGDCNKFIICEGTFDAIACSIMYPDYTPFAVLGSDITPYQIAMLRSYCPEEIKIFMDKTSLSERVRKTIETYINYADISIIESNGEDPEELLKSKLLEID